MSLTAQAFLFTIALGSDTAPFARIISALLAGCAALASVQLMVKHRRNEVEDSKLLEAFERDSGMTEIHAAKSYSGEPWYVRMSSYKIWLSLLWLFVAAAVVVLITALVKPGLLT